MKSARTALLLIVCLVAAGLPAGCVTRKLLIRAEPAEARIFLDGDEVTEQAADGIDFTFSGTRQVMVKKDGFQTEIAFIEVTTPWFQIFPIDFFAEFLYPGTLTDEQTFTFTLKPAEPFDKSAFLNRAGDIRQEQKANGDSTTP